MSNEEPPTDESPTDRDGDLRPVPARRAFVEATPSAIASQAVFVLAISAAVGGHREAIPTEPAFPLPRNLEALERAGGVFGQRLAVEQLLEYGVVTEDDLLDPELTIESRELRPLVDGIMSAPTPETATSLVEGCLRSRHDLVRAAAAASALDTVGRRDDVVAQLRAGARSDDELTGQIARAGLNRVNPNDAALAEFVRPEPDIEPQDDESNTSVITHGTFPSSSNWWEPGADLYDFLDGIPAPPNLHLHHKSFNWTGAWSEAARRAAAFRLDDWITSEGIGVNELDFFGHSHGGTIAHEATVLRAREFRRLILMSWPHRCEWRPDFDKVGKILDIRVRADAVILAERARQSFTIGGAEQAKITTLKNGWFKHSDPRRPSYWEKHDLVAKLRAWWP